MEKWFWLSLLAMFINTGKVFYIKSKCIEIDTWTLVFFARLLPALGLITALFWVDYEIREPLTFWLTTLSTVILTLLASVLYINAVKIGFLSLVVPLQATIPLFMVICTAILYGEFPKPWSLFFISLLVISTALTLLLGNHNRSEPAGQQLWKALYFSLVAAALFGISTILDRVAIAATTSSGALVYSAYWHGLSSLVLGIILYQKRLWYPAMGFSILSTSQWTFVLGYALLSLLAFLSQQWAVQESLEIENGITYVKSIVMMHISWVALGSVLWLRERISLGISLSSAMTFLSGMGLVYELGR